MPLAFVPSRPVLRVSSIAYDFRDPCFFLLALKTTTGHQVIRNATRSYPRKDTPIKAYRLLIASHIALKAAKQIEQKQQGTALYQVVVSKSDGVCGRRSCGRWVFQARLRPRAVYVM